MAKKSLRVIISKMVLPSIFVFSAQASANAKECSLFYLYRQNPGLSTSAQSQIKIEGAKFFSGLNGRIIIGDDNIYHQPGTASKPYKLMSAFGNNGTISTNIGAKLLFETDIDPRTIANLAEVIPNHFLAILKLKNGGSSLVHFDQNGRAETLRTGTNLFLRIIPKGKMHIVTVHDSLDVENREVLLVESDSTSENFRLRNLPLTYSYPADSIEIGPTTSDEIFVKISWPMLLRLKWVRTKSGDFEYQNQMTPDLRIFAIWDSGEKFLWGRYNRFLEVKHPPIDALKPQLQPGPANDFEIPLESLTPLDIFKTNDNGYAILGGGYPVNGYTIAEKPEAILSIVKPRGSGGPLLKNWTLPKVYPSNFKQFFRLSSGAFVGLIDSSSVRSDKYNYATNDIVVYTVSPDGQTLAIKDVVLNKTSEKTASAGSLKELPNGQLLFVSADGQEASLINVPNSN